MESKISRTRIITECAIMIALASVLSELKLKLPYGGSITLCACVPIILISYRHKKIYGFYTALCYAIIQTFLGLSNVLYCKTLLTQILCVMLDYLIAYTILGLASFFSKKTTIGTIWVLSIRFLCSFLSGILVWGEYAPDNTSVIVYSLVYNLSYMLPETIITAIAIFFISKRVVLID